MNTRLIRNILLCCVLLVLFTASAAQSQTRALEGDFVESPVSMLLNQKKTISGVEAATRQNIAIEASTCDALNNTQNSVWFEFETPAYTKLDIDTSGSVLDYGYFITNGTVLTVYRVNGPVLEEIDCAVGSGARLLDVALDKGSYMVRIAAPYEPLVGPSSYRLGLRVRTVYGLGNDPEFNTPLGTAWKVKNAGDPAKIFVSCANDCLRFDGVANGISYSKVSWNDLAIKAKKGDMLFTDIFVNDTPAAGANVKVTIKLIYSDGTPSNRNTVTRHVVFPTTGNAVGVGAAVVEIKSSALKSVKVMIASPAATDTFSVDIASFSMIAGSNVRGLLPVPPAH